MKKKTDNIRYFIWCICIVLLTFNMFKYFGEELSDFIRWSVFILVFIDILIFKGKKFF